MGKVLMPGGGGFFDDVLSVAHGGTGKSTAREAYKALSHVNVTAAGTSLDDYTEPGIYYFNSNVTPTNVPFGVNGWLVVLLSNNTNVVKHIWCRHGTANSNDWYTAVRTKTSNVWGDWVQLATFKELNRTNGVNVANTSYDSYMARGIALVTEEPSSMENGTVAFVYDE